ncbi:hypothetical protein [Faecalibaculum rodentium]|jgi:membrane-bound ClpP family serine protease|uniref:hypothetical protein n=1 Tax=Faecalibaculum rodentium TaxID=1702221 RepID=UPI00256EE5F3|nr:hypothetical protein [Faecalibaculum rodentium]
MTGNTNRNGLFLISAGCLFILLSCMMQQPIYLICTGIVLAAVGICIVRRDDKKEKKGKKNR